MALECEQRKEDCQKRFESHEESLITLVHIQTDLDKLVNNHYTEISKEIALFSKDQEFIKLLMKACLGICSTVFMATLALIGIVVALVQ